LRNRINDNFQTLQFNSSSWMGITQAV
jgi:hypothetical protein